MAAWCENHHCPASCGVTALGCYGPWAYSIVWSNPASHLHSYYWCCTVFGIASFQSTVLNHTAHALGVGHVRLFLEPLVTVEVSGSVKHAVSMYDPSKWPQKEVQKPLEMFMQPKQSQ